MGSNPTSRARTNFSEVRYSMLGRVASYIRAGRVSLSSFSLKYNSGYGITVRIDGLGPLDVSSILATPTIYNH